jgi:hypothetical protein
LAEAANLGSKANYARPPVDMHAAHPQASPYPMEHVTPMQSTNVDGGHMATETIFLQTKYIELMLAERFIDELKGPEYADLVAQ